MVAMNANRKGKGKAKDEEGKPPDTHGKQPGEQVKFRLPAAEYKTLKEALARRGKNLTEGMIEAIELWYASAGRTIEVTAGSVPLRYVRYLDIVALVLKSEDTRAIRMVTAVLDVMADRLGVDPNAGPDDPKVPQ